jgi:L-alanine-DL-glutamate epimerase-like enolase superfamily enzyme
MNLKLKVKDIERVYVLVPFTPRNQYWCAREQDVWQISEVVRVTADAPGLTGYGETIAPHLNGCKVTDAAVARVRGRNPADFLGDDSLGYGLQMALYDLVGKALDVPAYRLFNLPRVREWCPISWWNVDMSPEDYAAEAREAVARGYTSHKMKARPWWDIYAQVEAVRGAVPEYFRIDLDWNQTLINASNAAPVLTRLDGYEIVALYESPIFQRDVDGLRQLRAKTTRPLALHFGDPPFPTAVRGEACDGFVIGGGVASVLAQGALAAAFDKPFFLQLVGTGITTALSLQLGAVLPMAQWPAVNCLNLYSDDLLEKPFEIRGGYARLPEDPGLGITVDEAALERFQIQSPFDYVRTPQLLRVEWAGGRERYFATFTQCLTDALNGNMPIHEHGAKLTPLPDDGTPEWADLYTRAGQAPVFRQHNHF